jgi:hypothetical protein
MPDKSNGAPPRDLSAAMLVNMPRKLRDHVRDVALRESDRRQTRVTMTDVVRESIMIAYPMSEAEVA